MQPHICFQHHLLVPIQWTNTHLRVEKICTAWLCAINRADWQQITESENRIKDFIVGGVHQKWEENWHCDIECMQQKQRLPYKRFKILIPKRFIVNNPQIEHRCALLFTKNGLSMERKIKKFREAEMSRNSVNLQTWQATAGVHRSVWERQGLNVQRQKLVVFIYTNITVTFEMIKHF